MLANAGWAFSTLNNTSRWASELNRQRGWKIVGRKEKNWKNSQDQQNIQSSVCHFRARAPHPNFHTERVKIQWKSTSTSTIRDSDYPQSDIGFSSFIFFLFLSATADVRVALNFTLRRWLFSPIWSARLVHSTVLDRFNFFSDILSTLHSNWEEKGQVGRKQKRLTRVVRWKHSICLCCYWNLFREKRFASLIWFKREFLFEEQSEGDTAHKENARDSSANWNN